MLDINIFSWIIILLVLALLYVYLRIKEFLKDEFEKRNLKRKKRECIERNKIMQIVGLSVAIVLTLGGLAYVVEAIANERSNGNVDDGKKVVEYYIINANDKTFSYDDINKLSDEELYYIRNGVYAFHGKSFLEKELDNYYREFDWYSPQNYSSDVVKEHISPQEWELIELIQEIEEVRKMN